MCPLLIVFPFCRVLLIVAAKLYKLKVPLHCTRAVSVRPPIACFAEFSCSTCFSLLLSARVFRSSPQFGVTLAAFEVIQNYTEGFFNFGSSNEPKRDEYASLPSLLLLFSLCSQPSIFYSTVVSLDTFHLRQSDRAIAKFMVLF